MLRRSYPINGRRRILATAARCRGTAAERLTLEERAYAPHRHWSQAGVLAQRELEEEQRDAREDEHDGVRDQEGACGDGMDVRDAKWSVFYTHQSNIST